MGQCESVLWPYILKQEKIVKQCKAQDGGYKSANAVNSKPASDAKIVISTHQNSVPHSVYAGKMSATDQQKLLDYASSLEDALGSAKEHDMALTNKETTMKSTHKMLLQKWRNSRKQ